MSSVMDIRTHRGFTAGGWLALPAVGLTLAVGVDAARAAFPGANGRIAFRVDTWRLPDPCRHDIPHGCEPEVVSSSIETVQPSGRGRRVLRAFPVEQGAGSPVWSPSGRLLTFQDGSRPAIIRRDGTGLRRLPQLTSGHLTGLDGMPTWSPDGRRLAFQGRRGRLSTVRTDGTALRRVTARGSLGSAWSVTGTIALADRDGLYTIRPDGSRLRRVFGGRLGGPAPRPDWSPDGSRIAFSPGRHIFTIRADGRGRRRLTAPASGRTWNIAPTWSPDGKYIAFIRDDDLYVMRSNGRGVRRVVDAPQQDPDHPDRAWAVLSAPSWQPLPR
jgi:Tol biopolymer transport system component